MSSTGRHYRVPRLVSASLSFSMFFFEFFFSILSPSSSFYFLSFVYHFFCPSFRSFFPLFVLLLYFFPTSPQPPVSYFQLTLILYCLLLVVTTCMPLVQLVSFNYLFLTCYICLSVTCDVRWLQKILSTSALTCSRNTSTMRLSLAFL